MKKTSLAFILIALATLSACSKKPYTPVLEPLTVDKTAAAHSNISLGISYLKAGDVARAKGKFANAIKDAPKLSAAWYSMGYFYETVKQNKKAEAAYGYAIRLSRHDGNALNNYGTFLCRHGRYKKAIQAFVKAAKEPSYLTVGSAYENAGLCSMQAGNREAAVGYFKKAISNDPKTVASYFELAKINYDANHVDTAYKYYGQYAKLAKQPLADFFKAMGYKKAHKMALKKNVIKPAITQKSNILPGLNLNSFTQDSDSKLPKSPSRIAKKKTAVAKIKAPKLSSTTKTKPKHFHIQFFASASLQSAKQFVLDHQLRGQGFLSISSDKKNDVTRYHVEFGNYAAHQAAENAIKALPDGFKNLQPWIVSS